MTRGLGGHSPSNIATHLKGIEFPCTKDDLLRQARKNKADREVLGTLDSFPDRTYGTMAEVMEGFGESGGSSHGAQTGQAASGSEAAPSKPRRSRAKARKPSDTQESDDLESEDDDLDDDGEDDEDDEDDDDEDDDDEEEDEGEGEGTGSAPRHGTSEEKTPKPAEGNAGKGTRKGKGRA